MPPSQHVSLADDRHRCRAFENLERAGPCCLRRLVRICPSVSAWGHTTCLLLRSSLSDSACLHVCCSVSKFQTPSSYAHFSLDAHRDLRRVTDKRRQKEPETEKRSRNNRNNEKQKRIGCLPQTLAAYAGCSVGGFDAEPLAFIGTGKECERPAIN